MSPRDKRKRRYGRGRHLPTAVCRAAAKLRHPDQRSAESHARLLREANLNVNKTLRAYACGHCGGWHVGHRDKGAIT